MNNSTPPERIKLKQYNLEILRSQPVLDYELKTALTLLSFLKSVSEA